MCASFSGQTKRGNAKVYDTIIVGGGSAGSVLAHRLSARSANKVLLCEAGQDTPPGNEPPEIRDSYSGTAYFDPRFHWTELKVTTQVVSHNNPDEERPPLRKYEQARVLGGGSSINGQLANRGAPTDYEEWEARGAAGWSWTDVLPYFRKVERDLDFDGPFHGKDGRIPVRRIPQVHWTRHAQAVAEACKLAGYPFLPDQNGEFVEGYFPVTHSNETEQRVSAAMGYLDSETRSRANLTISTDTQVRELLFEGTRCVGVKAQVGGREQEIRGREVILSCGAIHSPAHLLRAGIGPVGHLREMGIPVLMGLEGVGQRLMDHPSIALSSFIRPGARMNEHTRRHVQVGLRYSSGLTERAKGRHVRRRPEQVGLARGRCADRLAADLRQQDLLRDRAGEARLARPADGTDRRVQLAVRQPRPRPPDERFSQDGGAADERAAQGGDRQAIPGLVLRPRAQDRRGQRQEQDSHRNCCRADGWADGAAPLHDRHIRRRRISRSTQVMSDDEAMEAFVRKAAIGVWHASCSCRMGRPDDPMTVVDTQGRVKGVQGLRVVDASIFPVVPCANTNFPTLMAAEKIAEAMQ